MPVENDFHNEIGEIVTLKSNFLKSPKHYPDVWLAGEPNYVTPLMIVSEILLQANEKINEETGEPIGSTRGDKKYKCIWFSNKDFKFEENWFFENELIKLKVHRRKIHTFSFGDSVVFKTNELEIKKRKSYLEMINTKNDKKTTPLLSFCSPVFTFIGYLNVEKKDVEIDTKTGKKKRWYPSKLAKIKTYNYKEDKYSEFTLPIEGLFFVNKPNENKINSLIETIQYNKTVIQNKKYYLINNSKLNGCYEPKSIVSIANTYYLEVVNVFNQIITEVQIDDFPITNPISFVELFKSFYPNVIGENFNSIENYILEQKKPIFEAFHSKSKSIVFKIRYKNKYDRLTERFIIPKSVIGVKIKEGKNDKTDYYLRSFCVLREEERIFKVSRILHLEVIENKQLNDFIFKIYFNIFM